MTIKLLSQKWGELPVTQKRPETPENLYFPGAEITLSQPPAKSHCYLIQQFKIKFFTIRYYCFYSSVKDLLTVITEKPSVTFRLGCSHTHQMITKELGKQVFHERAYNMFYDPDTTAEYPMEANDRFIFLDLLVEKEYSWYLQYYVPVTETFLKKSEKKRAGKLTIQNQVASTELWRWQEELHDWCYDADRDESNGLSIGNNLIENCIKAAKPVLEERGIDLTIKEANRISDAADLLLISDQSFTTQTLAKKVGLSAYKLNEGFKQIFTYPISKHRFENKMMSALRLIYCKGANLENVASALGYKHPRMFAQDFKKRFGFEPFEKRKQLEEPRS